MTLWVCKIFFVSSLFIVCSISSPTERRKKLIRYNGNGVFLWNNCAVWMNKRSIFHKTSTIQVNMMPETGRQATKKMVYLFVYISTLILNAALHTPASTPTHPTRLFSLVFRCMYYLELLLNRYKTFLSQQHTLQTKRNIVCICPDPANNPPKPQKSWIVLWSILHIVLLIMPWFMSTKS